MRRKIVSQKGASAVEFALVLPLLIMLTFGIIEFGFYLFNKQVITNASREGARAGIVARAPRLPDTGTDSITAVVRKYCGTHLITFGASNTPNINLIGYDPSALFGQELTVEVTYTYGFIVMPGFISGLAGNMKAVSVMRYE